MQTFFSAHRHSLFFGKLFIIPLLFIASCQNEKPSSTLKNPGDVLGSHVDSTVHPGDDFFQYANGAWIKKNPIPPSENGWGIFNLVADENFARLRKISEEASAQNASAGSASQQIGDFFFAGMDSTNIEKQGLQPLQDLLQRISNLKQVAEIERILNEMQMLGVAPLYNLYVGQDLKNSEKNMLFLTQGGLGLPDRDYYFNADDETKAIRKAYLEHLAKVFRLSGMDSLKANEDAGNILRFETELAASHKKLAELRDPYANYHKMSLVELNNLTPGMNWSKNFSQMEIKVDSVIVGQPDFFRKAGKLMATTPLDVIKSYLTFQLISSFSPYLNSSFDQENFNFYSATMRGAKEQRPRWKRVLQAEENALGDALGQLFVKEYFPEKTKKRYEDLTERIVESYREHIQKLDWMSDSTKTKALNKLNAITRKVGYPTTWKDYSGMKISRNSYCSNVMQANLWRFKYETAKLNKPVDRMEWGMTPQTYNAYYNPSNNEIVLPAAIFTAPGYKDEEIDDAVIYGYVGASTIGHELTHGFDDEGRQFDEKGNLKNWWSPEDAERFKKKAAMLIEQFNQYTVLGNKHPNGEATLGENIADLGGLVIALDAFKKTSQYKEGKSIAGLTPMQRYFMGYAYGWMQTRTEKMLATQLLTDVHAPIFLRVNGPMSNCDAWYDAFQVDSTRKMYRPVAERVRIW